MKQNYMSYSIILGAGAGLAFALFLWGFEFFSLISAHVAYAWLPGVIGMIACVLLCTLAAFLTRILKNALLGVVFWVLAAVGIAQLLVAIPIKITPWMMGILEPGLLTHLSSNSFNESFRFLAGTATILLAVFFGILGLLQNTLVDSAVPAVRPVGRMTPFLVMITVMIIASTMSGEIIKEKFREPLLVTNNLIQFGINHQGEVVPFQEALNVHLSTLDTVKDLINRPYRLFLGTYESSFGQVNVLVDFDGEWVDCTLINAQPVFCKKAGQ
jgi:hypothetical protein